MSFTYYFIFLLLLVSSCGEIRKDNATKPKGTLFIIGGGSRDSLLMERLITVSGWKKGDWISIAPMSSRWDSAYLSMNQEFQFYTRTNIRCIRVDSNTVRNPSTLDSMKRSKIVYLNGGDQSIFMMHIKGTGFKKAINEVYANGGTIAGTSAGAALMSEKMLTGNQLKDSVYRSAVPVLWQDNIEIVEGLGFLNSAIVDQHFIVRSRHNRLLSAVLENRMDGIGIDESTAIIIQGDSAAVVGESQVIVYRKPERTTRAGKNLIGAEQIGLSVYLPGDKFKIIH